jgi:prevent-host-death family protein
MADIGITEAKRTLSRLIDRTRDGAEIVITRRGRPLARLIPVSRFAAIRGSMRGQIHMADDFDELRDEITEAFGGR